MKHLRELIIIAALLIGTFPAGARAFDLPDEALKLLAQASSDPCSICAEQKTRKAFALLEKFYAPGKVLSTDGQCRLVKPSDTGSFDVSLTCYPSGAFVGQLKDDETPPRVVFTFYTPEKNLVGISGHDFTKKDIVDLYGKAKPGDVFEGRIEIIRFRYGDGEGFNYFRESRKLQIHCSVLELKPVGR
jgi:hypothetical protein